MRMPSEDAHAVVVVTRVIPGDRLGTWREAYNQAPGIVSGYGVNFFERVSRPHGHSWSGVAASAHSVFIDDIVSTLRDWADWESTWSVTPVVEPARKRDARLRRLAVSKLEGGAIPVDLDIDPLMLSLLDAAQADALHTLLDELFLPGIRWRFPRDRTGARLSNRGRVLLHECAPPAHPSGKGVWLVVDGPAPRTEPRLVVRLASAAGKGAFHRWDPTPEYWRTGPYEVGPRTLEQLWGIGPDMPARFVEEVTDALLAGRALDALAACAVTVDRGTRRLLAGLPDSFEMREWTDKWVVNATNLMANAAPWRWRDEVVPKQRARRLDNLGGFNPSRRPGLFLEWHDGGPHVSFDQSASPLVLPRVCWERDPDRDLIRLGLLRPDQIPVPSP
ncbi:MAG TPA: hypothetical protein VGJ07_22725 [Rugosimonospora sp.]